LILIYHNGNNFVYMISLMPVSHKIIIFRIVVIFHIFNTWYRLDMLFCQFIFVGTFTCIWQLFITVFITDHQLHDNINILQNALYLTDNHFVNFWITHHSLTILIV